MISVNGIWEECLLQPIKVNERDETFIAYREYLRKQVMETFSIPKFFNVNINGINFKGSNFNIPKKDKL